MNYQSNFFRILGLLSAVLMLTVLPMPERLAGARPPWVLLLLLYIQLYLPNYFRIITILVIGMCLDILLSTVIGEHAFALLVTTRITARQSSRFNFFTMDQQLIWILPCCLLYQMLCLLINAFLGYHIDWVMTIIGAILGVVIWPWFKLLNDEMFLIKNYYR
ncbi:MAG: rod shape-determining protein MreD [Legionella sp.]